MGHAPTEQAPTGAPGISLLADLVPDHVRTARPDGHLDYVNRRVPAPAARE